jgi:PAS domain S-box-containing protein
MSHQGTAIGGEGSLERLRLENEDLRIKLAESEQTLAAIRNHEVDALLVADRVYTLQSAERPYRLLVEQMQEGAATVTPNGVITYCNPRFAEMVRGAAEETIVNPFRCFVAPGDVPLLDSLLHHGATRKVRGELNLMGADGRPIPVILTVAPLPSEGEGHVCVVATDLTEHKRNQEIVAAEQLARSILDNVAEAVVVCDNSGAIIRFSMAARKLAGTEIAFQPFSTVFAFIVEEAASNRQQPADIAVCKTPAFSLAHAQNGQVVTGIEARLKRPDGTVAYLLVSSGPLRNAHGRTLGCVITMTDITERRALELELATAFEKDRRIAESLQRSLLLKPDRGEFDGLEVVPFYKAAWDESQLGGDFFDAFVLEGGHVALVVGDVSGKGLLAATRTAEIKFTLRAYLREHASPTVALQRLNSFLHQAQELENRPVASFVCLLLAIIHPAEGTGVFAAAGMEPPLLVRGSGEMEEIQVNGMSLGILPDLDLDARELTLGKGDLILMFTDGVTEARDRRELFGYDRVKTLVKQAVPLRRLEDIGQVVLDGAQAFAGGKLQDDVCLMLTRLI